MQSIYELATLDVQNEHDLVHKKLFSTPKIYDTNDSDLICIRKCIQISFYMCGDFL